jgi:hypothetical protein
MNDRTSAGGELDQRLTRLLRTIDAQPGFEARLGARLAREQARLDAGARGRARERALRARDLAEAALRRRLRASLLLIAGAAIAAVGPAWLCGRLLGRLLGLLPGDGGVWLAAASGALFIGWLWVALAQLGRRGHAAALLA